MKNQNASNASNNSMNKIQHESDISVYGPHIHLFVLRFSINYSIIETYANKTFYVPCKIVTLENSTSNLEGSKNGAVNGCATFKIQLINKYNYLLNMKLVHLKRFSGFHSPSHLFKVWLDSVKFDAHAFIRIWQMSCPLLMEVRCVYGVHTVRIVQ